jgi:hypothetical protein
LLKMLHKPWCYISRDFVHQQYRRAANLNSAKTLSVALVGRSAVPEDRISSARTISSCPALLRTIIILNGPIHILKMLKPICGTCKIFRARLPMPKDSRHVGRQ